MSHELPKTLPELDPSIGERKHLSNFDWRKIAAIHEELEGVAPEAEAHLRMMAWWAGLNVWDRADFRKALSILPEWKSVRWVASIPLSIGSAIFESHPELLKDRQELHRWLNDSSPMGGLKYKIPT